MKLSQFRFKLPEDSIALEPPHKVFKNEDGTIEKVYRRDECRMMVVHRKSQTIDMYKTDGEGNLTDEFIQFRDIVKYFGEGDAMLLTIRRCFPLVSMVLRRRQMPRLRCSCCANLMMSCACGMCW